MKPLILLSVVCGTLASCSVHLDSQYGLRLGPPAVRNSETSNQEDSKHPALPVESTPSSLTYFTTASDFRVVNETPAFAGTESNHGFNAQFEDVVVDHYSKVTEQSTEPEQPATEQLLTSDEQPASLKKAIPYWLEVTLGILGLIVGFGLILLSGFGIFISLFAILWGEVAAGALGLAISLIALVVGWLLVRYLLNNVLSFSLGGLSMGGGRSLNLFLGIAALLLLILLSA